MIELAFPWALLALPLPWLVWKLLPPRRERTPALRVPFFRRVVQAAGAAPRSGSLVLQRMRVQMAVAIVVWAAVVVALARPERVGEPIEVERAARDIVIAIDISGSMDNRDFVGTDGQKLQRLEAVKRAVSRFLAERKNDRIALIVFGAKAFLQSPFTDDLAVVSELLNQTEVGMVGPHTVIGDAIGLAIRTFEAREIDERLLILLSDGTDTGSRMSPVNAAAIAAQRGVSIFTIGVGDPEATGAERADLDALREIAGRAGGEFFFADDEAGLVSIYERIDELTPRKVEVISHRPRESLGHWFLGAAAVLILLATGGLHVTMQRGIRA